MAGSSPLTRGKRWLCHFSMRKQVAHPRSRGENWPHADGNFWSSGSSPLTRGKLNLDMWAAVRDGLIPAHAGKTVSIRCHASASPAHPRSRGENPATLRRPHWGGGSSPLTRGKHVNGELGPHVGGLIPAHAGKTARRSSPSTPGQAHPRSRGENHVARGRPIDGEGSSPLTRGKHGNVQVYPRAGVAHPRSRGENSRVRCSRASHGGSSPLARGKPCVVCVWAHPRSRGENASSCGMAKCIPGSSPLARGKRDRAGDVRPEIGLIPARAGKTIQKAPNVSASRAHPRSRGENLSNSSHMLILQGSSPLARGKPVEQGLRGGGSGLIPARAGKTRSRMSGSAPAGAHPRSRGENDTSDANAHDTHGSSPLARGKPYSASLQGAFFGLIPARAGKTAEVSGPH